MAQAKRDNNGVVVMIGASNADGITPLNLQVHPSTHILQCDDGSSGSDLSSANARRDGNSIPVLMAASSSGGITPVMLYVDSSTNKLLIKST